MEGTNISLLSKILYVLLPAYMFASSESLESLYKLLPNGHNVYLQDGTQAAFKSFKSGTRIQCASSCMSQEFCHVWRMENGYCHMFHSFLDKVIVKSSPNQNQKTYYETNEGNTWTEVYFFRGKSEFKASASFLGQGTYTSWGPASCTQNFCKDLFRSLLIDIWAYLPIKKVKFSLFKNNTEVLHVIFDGQETNSENWFTMSRVLKSPWKDVHDGATYAVFRINYNSQRSFYIAKEHGGCPYALGWVAVVGPSVSCNWDRHPEVPYIIYSDKEDATQWEKKYAVADALAVYISI